MDTRIRWGRIAIASVLSEAGVIATLLVGVAAYARFGPALSDAELDALGETLGYYVAPPAGVVSTLLSVLWAVRTLTDRLVAHGVLIGIGSVVLTSGFLVTASPEHRPMYLIAFALRILAGYAAGLFADWRRHASLVASRGTR